MGHVESVDEIGNANQIMVGKSQGKDPLKRPKHRLENNIKMALKEESVNWTYLAQVRV